MGWSEIFHWHAKQGPPVVKLVKNDQLARVAQMDVAEIITYLKSSLEGLSKSEAVSRLVRYGKNEVAAEHKKKWFVKLGNNFKDPLSGLLVILGIISYLTGDLKVTVIIAAMMLLSVILRFVQELKADQAAEKLKALVRTTATVMRHVTLVEIPLKLVVPGDIIHLSSGDMVPADIRILESKDLFVNQATLTGESLPAEKHAPQVDFKQYQSEFDVPNLCFMGTDVVTGTAKAIVVASGQQTYFGTLAQELGYEKEVTSFDIGIKKFTWLMIRFIFIMVPAVFLINGFSKGSWLEAFLFALAVAVGLTPEMLPMIVTVNLSKGALAMSRRKVIVKRLNAIQNFGAMDILCTDKTGTLTEGRVALIKYLDLTGQENKNILIYAYLNSFYQTGLRNLLDVAVLKHHEVVGKNIEKSFEKVDELPFDFIRRRMSVVVQHTKGQHLLLCKGAVEEVIKCCSQVQIGNKLVKLSQTHLADQKSLVDNLSFDGFRLIALAYKETAGQKRVYKIEDERNLILLGFLAFLDPPKESSGEAIKVLAQNGVDIRILTGDNDLVTKKVCSEVGISITSSMSGYEVQGLSEQELSRAVEKVNVFYKLEPTQKELVIKALQKNNHVVGYLGDGINDAPALKAADVGISVDDAVDIAKETSDIILLEKSLMVLNDGVRGGRRVFGNIDKYVRMAASSNFGNMFSVVGGSIFLPFLPMLPLQVIINNLLYDFSQVTIPSDQVDEEYLRYPRKWNIKQIQKFIIYLGPVSSLFDYATFFLMLLVFNCWANPSLFHTGWFVESLVSQTLVIHAIRTNKLPFIKSKASWPLTISTILVIVLGGWLPYSPFAKVLGFSPLPLAYWYWLAGFMIVYLILAHLVKRWFAKFYKEE